MQIETPKEKIERLGKMFERLDSPVLALGEAAIYANTAIRKFCASWGKIKTGHSNRR